MRNEPQDADEGVALRILTRDVDEHAAFWRRAGSDARIDQLAAGPFHGAIAAAVAPGGAVASVTIAYNRLVRIRGTTTPDRLELVLDHRGHGGITTRAGGRLGLAGAMAFGERAEVDVAWDSAPFGVLSCDLGLVREAASRIVGGEEAAGPLGCYRELDASASPRAASALGRLRGALRAVEAGAAGPWRPAAAADLLGDVAMLLATDTVTPRGERASAVRIRRSEEFLLANADRHVTIAELCGEVGAPERTLRADFRARFGVGPIAYLRRVRLNDARRTLLRGGAPSVTAAATACGFYHFGEFSAAYRAHFGELPSATLRRGSRPALVGRAA